MKLEQRVPEQFSGMSLQEFDCLIKNIPRGERLFHPESWRECIFVKGFLDLMADGANPLEGRMPSYIHDQPLEGRPLRVCWAFIRWFGTNCGQAALEALLKTLADPTCPYPDELFMRSWRDNRLYYPMALKEDCMTLDNLLNEGEYGADLPSDFATPADRLMASAFMEWLDSIPGTEYLVSMQILIGEGYERERRKLHEELTRPRLEADVAAFRRKRERELGLSPT